MICCYFITMILLMFSGGLDSTGALVKLLTETEEPLHIHHIIIRNAENRWRAEDQAVKSIIEYCKSNYRDFKFTSNIFGFSHFSSFICWDNDVVRFIAAQICKDNSEITRVALGKCKEDDDDTAFRLRALQSHVIWKACFLDHMAEEPKIIRPVNIICGTKGLRWQAGLNIC